MKKIFIGTLLGIALCLGGGQTVLAEGDIVEEVTANEDFATDETDEWEATDDPEGSFQGDASFGTVENDGNSTENADVFPQEAEDGFYSGTEELAFFLSEDSENAQENTQDEEPDPSSDMRSILDALPSDATSVTLNAQDGSDITDSLNLALKFMGERASDTALCSVIIPPGSYTVSDIIHMYGNLTLYARGAVITKACTDKHVILRLGDQDTSAGGYDGYRNVTIEGGTWDLNYPVVEDKEGEGGYVGFRIGHASHVMIKDVTFLNNLKSHFLEFAGVKDVTVTGCTFKGYWQEYEGGGQECIQLDACLDYIFPGYPPFDGAVCEDVRIENNTFQDVFAGVGSHSMVYDRPYQNIVIRGNTFRNIRKRAVWCLNYINGTVENNQMENVGGGVLVSNLYLPNTHLVPGTIYGASANHQAAGILVKGNQISISSVSRVNGNSWNGYGIQVQGARVSNSANGIPSDLYQETAVTVSGNRITGTGNGIRLYLADNCKVSGNELALSRSTWFSNMGIYLSASSGNSICNNKVSGCKNVGIYAYNGGSLKIPSSQNQITGNIVSGTGGDGIYISADSTGTLLSRNRVLSGKKNGMVVLGSKSCQITSNQVSGCALDGIYMENLGNAVVKSNKISSVKGRGIQVISSTTKSLYGNVITGSRKCGLYVYKSKIKGNKKNRLENNGSTYAIYAKGSSGITAVKLPTFSKITKKTVKITGKAAGGKTLTAYVVRKAGNKKIGRGTINAKKKYRITIKKQKKGTVLRFVLADKYGNTSYTNKKVK